MSNSAKSVAAFYETFWPQNVPHPEETRKYMLQTITGRSYRLALDAGCGHGVCSVVLSEMSDRVLAVDISAACVATARSQAVIAKRANIDFLVEDLQALSAPDGAFDLIWCWGVAMMAPEPMKVIHQLFRVTRSGGEIYLGLYLKTWLSPLHECIRHLCGTFMATGARKDFVLSFFAGLTVAIVWLRGREVNKRSDNVSLRAQVDDWYYPPYKTFYSISEILELFRRSGFSADCIQSQVGRM